jgi:hypothetical protein
LSQPDCSFHSDLGMERSSALIWGVMGLKNRSTLQEKLYWSDNCDLEDQKAGGEEVAGNGNGRPPDVFFPAPIPIAAR